MLEQAEHPSSLTGQTQPVASSSPGCPPKQTTIQTAGQPGSPFGPSQGARPASTKAPVDYLRPGHDVTHRMPSTETARTSRTSLLACQCFVRPRVYAPKQPTEAGCLQRRRATNATLCLHVRSLTLRHRDAGWLRSALARKEFNADSPLVTHSASRARSSPSPQPQTTTGAASPVAHQGEQPTRAQGNQGHPSPLYEGCDPLQHRNAGRVLSAAGHEKTHGRINDEAHRGRADEIHFPTLLPCDPRLLLVWRLAAEAMSRCNASERPGSHTVVARPTARTRNPGAPRSPLAFEQESHDDRRSDTHRNECRPDDLVWIEDPDRP